MEVDVRRTVPLVCICLLLLTAAESAFAQQRLFVKMESEVVELDPRPVSLGAVLRRFPVPAGLTSSAAVSFGGGRFLAWADGGAVILLNTQSGAVQRFAFPDFSPRGVLGTDGNARLLIAGSNASGRSVVLVADARSGSIRLLDVERFGDVPPSAYAAASDIAFVARPFVFADVPRLVDVIHASTGALIKTLDVSPIFPFGLSTNASGTRLFVSNESGAFVFDVVSGALLASNTSDQALKNVPSGITTLDDHRNRLVVSVRPGVSDYEESIGISAFAADSLQFLGKVRVPELPLPPTGAESYASLTQQIDVSGLSATIFALQAVEVRHGKYYPQYTCAESQLIALHADTGAVRRTVSTTAVLRDGACAADLIRITEPAPPPTPTANVSGRQVTLNWQVPFGATHYEVEAGSAPGLANITTIEVSDPKVVIDGVPSGTYHVRVRAINTIGKSGASQDIRVVVP